MDYKDDQGSSPSTSVVLNLKRMHKALRPIPGIKQKTGGGWGGEEEEEKKDNQETDKSDTELGSLHLEWLLLPCNPVGSKNTHGWDHVHTRKTEGCKGSELRQTHTGPSSSDGSRSALTSFQASFCLWCHSLKLSYLKY